jgi:hypothetical protein
MPYSGKIQGIVQRGLHSSGVINSLLSEEINTLLEEPQVYPVGSIV